MFAITIVSILVVSFLIWILKPFLPFQPCPICVGVSGTWIWLLAGRLWGYEFDPVILALLMGGSVVGLTSKLDKNWKILFVPLGFSVVYGLILKNWVVFIGSLFLLLLALLLFLLSNKKSGSKKKPPGELEQKMKDCC